MATPPPQLDSSFSAEATILRDWADDNLFALREAKQTLDGPAEAWRVERLSRGRNAVYRLQPTHTWYLKVVRTGSTAPIGRTGWFQRVAENRFVSVHNKDDGTSIFRWLT